MSLVHIIPRVIRLRDAPGYLGMDKNRFNAEVRPVVNEFRIGRQGIGFDRLELDSWVEQYKRRNGRPATQPRGELAWGENVHQGYEIAAGSGTSKNRFSDARFAKALEQATSKRRS